MRDLQARLSRLEGHLRAVSRMLEEGTGCEEVLVQLMSIRAALNSLAIRLVQGRIEQCMERPLNVRENVQELKSLKGAISAALKQL
ncbi:MAG: metal-sensitive transcriptional regulator [Nitrospinota bacterium]